IMIVVGLLSSVPFIGPAMLAGYFLVIFRKLRGEKQPAVGDVFEGFQMFVPALLVGIVGGFIGQLGIIACIVGVFATQALVLFAMPLVVDRKMDFWPAIQMSMDKVKENLVAWSVFVLAIGALQLLGAIVCVVGTLVTAPIAMVAIALAYRDNFGIQGAAGAGAAAPPSAPQVPPTVPPTPPSPTA
ncbi:MAG: hypothetical protein J7M38_07700, partial [Armatimonadetes bacterium]|nr:hypothetical protein [Armatimonadota bacterium]